MRYLKFLLVLIISTNSIASDIKFIDQIISDDKTTLVTFSIKDTPSSRLDELTEQSKQQLKHAIEIEQFESEYGSTIEIVAPNGLSNARLIVVGLGDKNDLTQAKITKLGGELAGKLNRKNVTQVTVDTRGISVINNEHFSAWIAHGINLRLYRFEKYLKEKSPETFFSIISDNAPLTREAYQPLNLLEKGIFLARDLISETATHMTPIDYVDIAEDLEDIDNVSVKVLSPKQIKNLGMGALEAVGRGSKMGSRLVIVHYEGDDSQPIALVGKGITFDSGGYNIKTGSSIARMKSDMAGAAAVMGTVKALALQKVKVNVVAVMGMAANMVSETSVTPGDVIRTAEGVSVEILNTDAEGRLVLSDAMWYARKYYNPKVMVDVATLTGSKVRAVGNEYAAIFSADDELVSQLTNSGKTVNENLWRLPLDYKDKLKSDIADIANIGNGGPGASTAASFLQYFAGDTRWAHLDIAGNALSSSAKGEVPVGGTGFGVRLLTQWILDNHTK
ncbi:MAG: leucyl aminopeptidase family protein [Gammaproteobacteria bacterium]|nr:leucyl aminopeptidase family protein [Gammaproteobacteria bacterium]